MTRQQVLATYWKNTSTLWAWSGGIPALAHGLNKRAGKQVVKPTLIENGLMRTGNFFIVWVECYHVNSIPVKRALGSKSQNPLHFVLTLKKTCRFYIK